MTLAMPLSTTTLDRDLIAAFLAGEVEASALPEPRWGPIGREVHTRTYARPVGERLEGWAETCRRVTLGNLSFAPESAAIPDEAIVLFDLMFGFGAVPAGRHLWTTGTGSAASRNCFVSGHSPRLSDHYRFLAARLFEGSGVGANYSDDQINASAKVLGAVTVKISCDPEAADYPKVFEVAGDALVAEPEGLVYRIVDTREGWVDAWAWLIDLATEPGQHVVTFDVSAIRPFGAALVSTGGQASGPAPLVVSLIEISTVLSGAVGRHVDSLESMTIDHEIARATIAGGKRRAARMSMKLWSDEGIFDFIACKADQSKHWSTNISVEITEEFAAAIHDESDPMHQHANAVLVAVSEDMVLNGEPGLINSSVHSIGEPVRIRVTNPCSEASLTTDPTDAAGESCNLGSIDLESFGTDVESAKNAFRMTARFLYRATLNTHPDEAAGRIEATNRRIGVGLMGLQGWCVANGARLTELPDRPDLLAALHEFRIASRDAANEIADELGLPHPVKDTAVAPTGSISALFGGQPGVHPVTAKYLLRRVRYSSNDPALVELARSGYSIVDDPYSHETKVVSFPCIDPIVGRHLGREHLIQQADEISVEDFMKVVLAVQESFCAGEDGQAVSATALIEPDMDPAELYEAMLPYVGRLKGVTVFPNATRELQPILPLTEAEYRAAVRDVDESAAFMALLGESEAESCVSGACPVR